MGSKINLYDSDEVKQRIIAVDDSTKRVEIRNASDTDIMDIEAHASRHVNGGDDEVLNLSNINTAVGFSVDAHASRHEKGGADEVTALGSISLDDVTLASLTADPSLAEGKLWYRSDLDRLQYAISDTTKREIPYGTINVDAHASRHASGGADEITGIAKSQLASNTIQWVEVIDLLNGELSVDASATGDTDSAFDIKLDAELLQSAKAAYLEVAYTWAATADGTIKLYDVTAAADVTDAAISLTGGESSRRDRTADFLSNLTSGHDVRLRVTITATASETATIHAARLIIVCGAS